MSELKVIDVYIDSDTNLNNDDESIESSTVSVKFSSEVFVNVQMSGGEFREDLGCLVYLIDDDDIKESIRDKAIKEAEEFIDKEIKKTFVAEFVNDAFMDNDASIYIRVDKHTGECHIMQTLHCYQDCRPSAKMIKKFDGKKEALEFMEEKRDESGKIDLRECD